MLISLLTNQFAMVASRSLKNANRAFATSVERLTSGTRLNEPADDPSDSAMAANLEVQLKSLQAAVRNIEDANSLIRNGEGGLNEINNMLMRWRELAIQASSSAIDDRWRGSLVVEASALQAEIDRIAQTTGSGNLKLLNGSVPSLEFQVGTTNSPDSRVNLNLAEMDVRAETLGLPDPIALESADDASDSLSAIDSAIGRVVNARSQAGAFQNRMESIRNLMSQSYLLGSSRLSRLRDTDYAEETSRAMLTNARSQALTMILAQANLQSNVALRLIEGK